MSWRILFWPYSLSLRQLIILNNCNIYLDGPILMWLISSLIFLSPVMLSYTLSCPCFLVLSFTPVITENTLSLISNITLSLLSQATLSFSWWGAEILVCFFLHPRSRNHITHQGPQTTASTPSYFLLLALCLHSCL